MEMRKNKCPYCQSINTRDYGRSVSFGYKEIKETFPEYDDSTYLVEKCICDDCDGRFTVKSKIDIMYKDAEGTVMTPESISDEL